MAAKVRKLKAGESFRVKTDRERKVAVKEAWTLRRYGLIDFQIATRRDKSGGFNVVAI